MSPTITNDTTEQDTTPRLYKWLNTDGTCIWGQGSWPLPKHPGEPGAWLPKLDGELKPCEYGYHAFEAADLEDLLPIGSVMLVEVELVNPIKDHTSKWLSHSGRIVRVVFANHATFQYHLITQSSLAEYDRAIQPARAEYDRAMQLAMTAYRDHVASLLHAAGRDID